MKHKIAMWIYLVLSIVSVIYGAIYVVVPNMMSYHEALLRQEPCTLAAIENSACFKTLYHALMRVSGSCMIAIGIAAIFLALNPHKNEEKWVWWPMNLLFTLTLVPLFLITFWVAEHISEGAKPPYYLPIIMFFLMVVAAVLSFPYGKKKNPSAAGPAA